MKTKIAACSNCCPEGGACLTAERDYDGENFSDVWECNNCLRKTPRRVNKKKDETSSLTKAQINAITRIQQYKLTDHYGTGVLGDVEVKSFGIRRGCTGTAYVTCVVGRIGDEGKWTSILCRDRGNFQVGTKGGITAFKPSKSKATKADLKKYPLIYGWGH